MLVFPARSWLEQKIIQSTLAKLGWRDYNAKQLAAENTLMAEDAADLGGLKRPPLNILWGCFFIL